METARHQRRPASGRHEIVTRVHTPRGRALCSRHAHVTGHSDVREHSLLARVLLQLRLELVERVGSCTEGAGVDGRRHAHIRAPDGGAQLERARRWIEDRHARAGALADAGVVQLLHGLTTDRSSTLAAPALTAYNKVVAEDKRVAQGRGRELPAGFTIVKAPAGLAPVLAPVMHLVDALVRMRLLADDTAMSVPFETRAGKMSLLKGDAALAARRQVASHITERTTTALRRPLNSEDPDLCTNS